MMTAPTHPNSTQSRVLALGLLAALILVLVGLIALPVIILAQQRSEEIADLEFRMERYRKVAAEKKAWLDRLEQIKAKGQDSAQFSERETPALASADLQSLIKETVTGAGGELTSTQVIPDQKEDQFIRISVKVRMNGGMAIMREVLHRIESARPFLLIDNLNARPLRMQRNLITRRMEPTDSLTVDFDVIGYMRAPA